MLSVQDAVGLLVVFLGVVVAFFVSCSLEQTLAFPMDERLPAM